MSNICYTYNLNHYFDKSQKEICPLVITLPDLKLNHRVAFDQVHQLIFCLANISLQVGGDKVERKILIKRKSQEDNQ